MSALPTLARATEPPAEDDDTIQCDGCHETFRHREMRDRAGWVLCPDCASDHDQAADRETTRALAYAH